MSQPATSTRRRHVRLSSFSRALFSKPASPCLLPLTMPLSITRLIASCISVMAVLLNSREVLMASSTSTLTPQNDLSLWSAIAKLARWRFKRMWRLLLVTWLGMLTMVVLVCAGPLFLLVSSRASVRSQLASAADGAYITIDASSIHPTQDQLQ